MKIKKLDLSHLTQRERTFLIGGGAIVGVLLLYLFVFAPFSEKVAALKQIVHDQRFQNDWIERSIKEIQGLKLSGIAIQEIKKENFLASVEELMSQDELNNYLEKIQEREAKIALTFKNVPFDWLIQWLVKIWKNNAISVSQISVSKGNVEGVVNAQVLLQ